MVPSRRVKLWRRCLKGLKTESLFAASASADCEHSARAHRAPPPLAEAEIGASLCRFKPSYRGGARGYKVLCPECNGEVAPNCIMCIFVFREMRDVVEQRRSRAAG